VKEPETARLYKRVYDLLIAGKHQAEISRDIRYDKAHISRITKALIQGGYIVCINPNSRQKFYEATKKKFLLKDARSLTKVSSVGSQRSHRRCNILFISKSTYKTTVRSEPKIPVKWDDERFLTNGVKVQQYNYPFENLGLVRFMRYKGSNQDNLYIVLPKILWEREAGPPHDYLREMADRCGTWFMHHFKIELSGLEESQRPDIGVAAREPELIHAAQNASFNVNGMMLDTSAPDYTADVESKDFDDIINYLDSTKKIKILEMKVNHIEETISKLDSKLDYLIGLFEKPEPTPDSFRGYV